MKGLLSRCGLLGCKLIESREHSEINDLDIVERITKDRLNQVGIIDLKWV